MSELYEIGDYLVLNDRISKVKDVTSQGYSLETEDIILLDSHSIIHQLYKHYGPDLERAKKEVIKWKLKN